MACTLVLKNHVNVRIADAIVIDRRSISQRARLRDDAAQTTRELPMQSTRHCIASHQLVS